MYWILESLPFVFYKDPSNPRWCHQSNQKFGWPYKKKAGQSFCYICQIDLIYVHFCVVNRKKPIWILFKRIISSIFNLNNRMYLGKFVKLLCFYPYIDFIFRIHRLTEQRCGQVVESFGYNDHNGRLEETRKNCQRRPTKFIYAPNSQRVSEYVMWYLV